MFPRKVLRVTRSAVSEGCETGGFGDQRFESAGPIRRLVPLHQQTRFTVADGNTQTADVSGDHGSPTGLRLDGHQAK
jgi:hypothetical protein